MPRPRYLSRRLGRSQNGMGEGLSVAAGAAPDSSERPVPPPENHPFPPAGRDPDAAPPDAFRRAGGCAVARTGAPEVLLPLPLPLLDGRGARGGAADLPLAVPLLAADPRAQAGGEPAEVDPSREGSGNGGAARLAPPPASGHCLFLPLAPFPPALPPPPAVASADSSLVGGAPSDRSRGAARPSEAGAPFDSLTLPTPGLLPVPVASSPPLPAAAAAAAPATPPAAAAAAGLRRAQRAAREAPTPGTTAPAALADARRKPKLASRQLYSARSVEPIMP
jgi:hypothetical protein